VHLMMRMQRPMDRRSEPGAEPPPVTLVNAAAGPRVQRVTILHVVESLGSGVTTALEDYLRSTPDYVHVVLGWRRPEAQTGDQLARLAT
jgi:hypothetical protein